MLTALLLTAWAVICKYDELGPTLIYATRPLLAGTVAGAITGHLTLGMAIGAALEFAALGSYTYGGSTTPEWHVGTIIGVAVASNATGPFTAALTTGTTIGVVAATILVPLDPLGRTATTFWIHRADFAAVQARSREMTVLHFTAFIPWAAVRAIPTFIATYFLSGPVIAHIQNSVPVWLVHGFTLAGGILPVVGFAMLLRLLPVNRYWYFLLIGFVLFAYANVTLLGVTLFGIAIAIIYVTLKPQQNATANAGPAAGPSETKSTQAVGAGEASDV